MLPENRLAVLLEQVKQSQIDTCLYHTEALSPSLYSDHYCDNRNFPVVSALILHELEGEIWQVLFSPDGSKLAAAGGSDKVVIWDSQTWAVLHELGGHNLGVGKLAWSPDGSMIVTCSQDKHARIWNAEVR
jgi:WD repeat-containing protein 26